MAIFLDSASPQVLKSTVSPVTGRPHTVGIWLWEQPVDSVNRVVYAIGNNALATASRNMLSIITNGGSLVGIESTQSGSANSVTVSVDGGRWCFALCRWITSTNDRIDVYEPWSGGAGSITSNNRTTGSNPGSFNEYRFGHAVSSDAPVTTNAYEGVFGEFWYTATDLSKFIPTSSAATGQYATLVRQLAWGGPLSVPGFMDDVLEYRSFRYGHQIQPTDFQRNLQSITRQSYTVVNGPIRTVAHMSLPYWNVVPQQRKSFLIA